MPRLRRVSSRDSGWTRRPCGRGFRYLDEDRRPLPGDAVTRIKSLAIPPAWREVWICPDERGHLQATGTDAAGRTQYLYHDAWRSSQDAAKFDRALAMARRLPAVRRRLQDELVPAVPGRAQVLAAAVRLLDLGCFRVGADVYTEAHGSFGLTTLERRHVRRDGAGHRFEFEGKSGVRQEILVVDAPLNALVEALSRRRKPAARLLCFKEGRRWTPVTAPEINAYIGDLFASEVTAKDLRTWRATVVAAASLSEAPPAATRTGRQRQVRAALRETAEYLGNTPPVARASYVDPRVLDLFERGVTIRSTVSRLPRDPRLAQDRLDRAVARLLGRS